jgi:integrase
MKKTWLYQRKNRQGWYVGWYDKLGRRRSKMCPNKTIAKAYADRLQYQMNEDLYFDPVSISLEKAVDAYLEFKEKVEGLTPESVRSITHTLKKFRAIVPCSQTALLSQTHVDHFLSERKAAGATVNKDLRNLRTFFNWLVESRYLKVSIKWRMRKQKSKAPRTITIGQLQNLLEACMSVTLMNSKKKPTNQDWYCRIMLAATSGLREDSIESLKASDFDFTQGTFATFSRKTQKGTPGRPLHPAALQAVQGLLRVNPSGRLLRDKFKNEKWKRIRDRAGLTDLKFHDLRAVFASFLAQAGYSTSVIQNLLEHSTPNLTHSVYTNVDPVYRQAVDSIKIEGLPVFPPESFSGQPVDTEPTGRNGQTEDSAADNASSAG